MKAFISYSHKDSKFLERLHTHLTQIKRDGKLTSWTDEIIPAGGAVNDHISNNLETSQIFIALLSPDYIASNYCYEKEFTKAIKMQENGTLIIIPIILEPCDWLNTPFREFKALPKDGKAISDWNNANTAFLDVVQNLRKLIGNDEEREMVFPISANSASTLSRNYRVKKDFDSLQKIEFIEQSFNEVKENLTAYLKELEMVDENIKYRVFKDGENIFESLIVNRNKINTEATLQLVINAGKKVFGTRQNMFGLEKDLMYSINASNSMEKAFSLSNDEYSLFWVNDNYYGREKNKLTLKEITDIIWNEWLGSVGII